MFYTFLSLSIYICICLYIYRGIGVLIYIRVSPSLSFSSYIHILSDSGFTLAGAVANVVAADAAGDPNVSNSLDVRSGTDPPLFILSEGSFHKMLGEGCRNPFIAICSESINLKYNYIKKREHVFNCVTKCVS